MASPWHVSLIDQRLPQLPFARKGGSLLMMVGLPGSGKSTLVDTLASILPILVVRTDEIRRHMKPAPNYTKGESVIVYGVCQQIIERRLRQGQRVVFDATNYRADRRNRMYTIARRTRAPIVIGHVQATEEVIRQRLYDRNRGKRREGDLSEADWSVYQWMVYAQEPIKRTNMVLDTTNNPPDVLAARLRDYWFEQERLYDRRGTTYL